MPTLSKGFLVSALFFASYFPILATAGRCKYRFSNGEDSLQSKIEATHRLKGSFETLHPLDPHSIAVKFPVQYARIMRLFRDRPSYLMGMNRGNPPVLGMPLGEVYRNIQTFAGEIGEDLDYIFQSLPEDFYALPLLKDYSKRFRSNKTSLVESQEFYNPLNRTKVGAVVSFGKKAICSVWAELRISLRIGHLSRVNVKVEDMIADGIINNDHKFFDLYRQQEIDHFWFPSQPGQIVPEAVALGETKVFDRSFSSSYPDIKKVYAQFQRYLEIASAVGSQLGLPPRVYYFFVAGISQGQIDRMQSITTQFNADLITYARTGRTPVELLIFGDNQKP